MDVDQGKESVEIGLPESLPDDIAAVIVSELNKPASDIEAIKRVDY